MDDMINRHDSIAEENIEPNGRPAKDQFEEWSGEVADRADDVFKNDKKDGPIKNREKRIKEMDEVIKKDLEYRSFFVFCDTERKYRKMHTDE